MQLIPMSVTQISLELSEEAKRNQDTKLAQVFAMHRQSCLSGVCISSGQWLNRMVRSRNRQLCWINHECQSPEAISHDDYPQESLA